MTEPSQPFAARLLFTAEHQAEAPAKIIFATEPGRRPGLEPLDADKVQAALKLAEAGLSPTKAANQLGLGRSTVYREVVAADLSRGV